MTSVKASPFTYAFLAAFFAGSFAFQVQISISNLHSVWLDAQHFQPSMLRSWAILLNLHVLTPVACLVLGFYVAAVRMCDPKAWLLLAVLVSFSLVSDGSNVHDEVMEWHTPLKHLALVYRSVVINSWPIFMLLFGIYFPDRAEFDRRHPWRKWLVLTPALMIYALVVFVRVFRNENAALVPQMSDLVGSLSLTMLYVLLLLSLAILTGKFMASRDPDDRRRLRVLFTGLGISFLPAITLDTVARRLFKMRDTPAWLAIPVFTVLILFPITLAYVTLVQRALDVRVILRHGLQYAMAKRGLVLLQLFVSSMVVLLVALLSGHMTFFERVSLTAAGIGILFLIGLGARKLARWIDRFFFREAYNTEQILEGLAEAVGSLVELKSLLGTVTTRIAEALHISGVAVFLSEHNAYRMAYSCGYASVPEIAFDKGSPTLEELRRTEAPLPVYLDDPQSWVGQINGRERADLDRLGSQLLLPLSRREELLGFISLGPRQSEAPYSPSDINLLHSVARQTALSVENSRLTSTIAAETAEREVIQRELSIARDVQQRLLPQSYPSIDGIQCFGLCRPAREVGGDYYDFLELPDGVLGMAIGDVSGKGIPASLLMASLQASLRGQTLGGPRSLEELMINVNRLVYAASPLNRYATFFYAQYDPNSRRLAYVNAGHNAPFVIKREDGSFRIIRLEAGGPPVGLLPLAPYESAQAELTNGDLIILFTDGVSEAMNMHDEEWGEERLVEVIQKTDPPDPEAIVQAVFKQADEFAGEAPQHDDMTIVVFSVQNQADKASRR